MTERERQAVETALGSIIGANKAAQLQTNISSIAESSAAPVIMAGSAPAPAPSIPGTGVTLHGSPEVLLIAPRQCRKPYNEIQGGDNSHHKQMQPSQTNLASQG